MRTNRQEEYGAKAARSWLQLLVHLDAFRAAPLAYLTAIRWWAMGKRLRARGQLAPLLNRSPRAYGLWALQQEKTKASACNDATFGPAIIALIDITAGQDGLDDTRSSLSKQGVPTLLIDATSSQTFVDAATQIDWSQNPWLMPMTSGDKILPGGIVAYRGLLAEQGTGNQTAKIIYADDDLLSRRGRRHDPHFKPDWNGELFRHFDYLTGSCIIRTSRQDWEAIVGANDWTDQLVLHATSQGTPLHLRKMLHHRRVRPAPRVPAKPIIASDSLPSVTVIIPTRNHVNLLRTCLEGLATTRYPHIEVIVVDNDSDDTQTLSYLGSLDATRIKLLRHGGVFNYSAINNRAVGEAQGHLLCLLNNDIEVTDPDWLATMAVPALRDEVGAVGAQLLYPDGRIQHAGVVIGIGNAAGHGHRFVRPDEEGYFRRHALPQFTSAVTAACLVVEREKFLAVGGLDETNFPVAFNDVDLCLRLNQRGWQSIYEPRATLIHHESVSRGLDQDTVGAARFASELAALQRLWHTDDIVDPYHHPQLSRASERFAVAI